MKNFTYFSNDKFEPAMMNIMQDSCVIITFSLSQFIKLY